MKIGIDARMYGPEVGGGGLGRYVEQLVCQLQDIDDESAYLVYLKKDNFDAPRSKRNFEKKLADIHWYTLKEQLRMGRLIDQDELDLVHFPHWNVPLVMKTPFVVTIHDLILLDEPKSAKVSTLHPFVFKLKYLAYKFVLGQAIKKSKHIIAVSNFTRDSILKHFPDVDPDKISVIYEGVTDVGYTTPDVMNVVPTSYLLYVGNAYPHKNLEKLVSAFSILVKEQPDVELVLAGRKDVFYEKLERVVKDLGLDQRVRLVMNPSDQDLRKLYSEALALIHPSKIEGFGLTPLEAMSAGVPVAASKAGSLPEILGPAAIYFSPDDTEQMAAAMKRIVLEPELRSQLIELGREQIKKYSWKNFATKTHALYARILKQGTKHNK